MKRCAQPSTKSGSSSRNNNNNNNKRCRANDERASVIEKKQTLLNRPPFILYRQQPRQSYIYGSDKLDPSASSKHEGDNDDDDNNNTNDAEPYCFKEGFAAAVDLLRGKKHILVLAGAGMSVSCGIPDFRTPGTGLYETLDAAELGLSCPEELFDWHFFQEDPRPFYKFARNLYFPAPTITATTPALAQQTSAHEEKGDFNRNDSNTDDPINERQRVRPSDAHKLLATLQARKMLLRVYSQNIDGLEEAAGVLSKKVVYAHGSLRTAKCCQCKRKVSAEAIEKDILAGIVARCQVPVVKKKKKKASINSKSHAMAAKAAGHNDNNTRTTRSNQNKSTVNLNDNNNNNNAANGHNSIPKTDNITTSTGSTASDNSVTNAGGGTTTRRRRQSLPINNNSASVCGGVLKPDVTFFGEVLHDNVGKALESDRNKVDALIVIGTSLSVAPVSKVIGYLPPNIPRILINRCPVHPAVDHRKKSNDKRNDSDDSDEEDFRNNYVFDAYLLGFCDDVTRALAKQLLSTKTPNGTGSNGTSRVDEQQQSQSGMVLANLLQETKPLDSDERYNKGDNGDNVLPSSLSSNKAEDWSRAVASLHLPPERVFLFPGAQPPTAPSTRGAGDDDACSYHEIAHCDGCSDRIEGAIFKCATCFDFDLCSTCYPVLSKTHFHGEHKFFKE